jgi:hypothetical protein
MNLARQFNIAARKLKRKKSKEIKKSFKYGTFSSKALDVFDNANAPLNVFDGSVGSSKTITATIKWLSFLGESHNDEFLQSGKTRGSLYRNVLRDEFAMLNGMGIDYHYYQSDGYIEIDDKIVWTVGFKDERVTDVIRGMTIGGWYADETNTYPQSAVEEALDRIRLPDPQSYWTMNPDNPLHYINTGYILNEGLISKGLLKRFHFVLADNKNLPQSYIDTLYARYPVGSVGYKRKILGLWVVAEGIIYKYFIEGNHTFPFDKWPYANYDDKGNLISLNYDQYVIASDYGAGSVTVFGLFGIKRGLNGNEYHLLREFYWDASENGPLTTSELINGVPKKDIIGAFGLLNNIPKLDAFYTPHDAAALRAELIGTYFKGSPISTRTYTPDVLNDIENIQSIISQNKFLISTSCVNSVGQAQTYGWDSKAQKKGESRPLKVNDHCPDMWRAVLIGTRGIGTGNIQKKKRRYNSRG